MSRHNEDRQIKIAAFTFAIGTVSMLPQKFYMESHMAQKQILSLGIIAYILLGGYLSFIEQNNRELFKMIKRGQCEFHVEREKIHLKRRI
jgi:hypothetical protein